MKKTKTKRLILSKKVISIFNLSMHLRNYTLDNATMSVVTGTVIDPTVVTGNSN